MIRAVALQVALLAVANMALDADHSRNAGEPRKVASEPPILKQNLSNEPLSSEAEVARLEKQFQLAKQIAASAARLCKIGVPSKVEMEQRLLKVIQCKCK